MAEATLTKSTLSSVDTHLAEIGNLISALRQERGITQKEFAAKLGTTQSAIARIELGEQNLSTEMLAKIGRALNRDIVQVSTGALNIKIEGNHKLQGEISTKTSKNGAMGILAASLLNKNKTTIKNVPKIEEVFRMIEVFESIGVSVKWNENDLEIKPAEKLDLKSINRASAEKTRSIIMLIGPLIHFYKKFKLPQPGGCHLGSRTVRPHLYALENLGVSIDTKEKYYEVSAPKLHTNEIILYESGDTVTENAIMAAALIPGKTVIKYASANYMGQELCFFLEQCGIKIEGIGTATITVHGIKEIDKPITYYLSEDPIESMFFIAAAIVTKSKLTIKRCPINFLELELLKLEKMGLRFKKNIQTVFFIERPHRIDRRHRVPIAPRRPSGKNPPRRLSGAQHGQSAVFRRHRHPSQRHDTHSRLAI
jgi:UDP-N-acetylglucosamine 1-carboxyvinyltransferase